MTTAPIVKEITVPIDPDRAFRLFTDEMADWWPLESHSLSANSDGAPAERVDVPGEVGKQVLETKPDGSRVPWGRVTEYSPGAAYGMTWHVGRPEDQATHVRVTFDAVAYRTKVVLVHDGWDALGETASALHGGYTSGWDMVLGERYATCACQLVLA